MDVFWASSKWSTPCSALWKIKQWTQVSCGVSYANCCNGESLKSQRRNTIESSSICALLSQATEWDPGWPRLCHVQHVVSKFALVLPSSWPMGEKRESFEKAKTLLNLDLAWVRHTLSLPISHWWKRVTYLIARGAGKCSLSCFSPKQLYT